MMNLLFMNAENKNYERLKKLIIPIAIINAVV